MRLVSACPRATSFVESLVLRGRTFPLDPIFYIEHIHLCEAFLGIEPHYALFQHLFQMKITSGPSPIVGSVVIQFRQWMKSLYVDYSTKESLKD